ncbi:hypothetical protein TNCV_829941 [Trichonephila clavipes]|nr:hypothetical protein TNCV_829941 [Trichonephila clavipes]
MLTSSPGAPDFGLTEAVKLPPFTMNLSSVSNHSASPVAQKNKFTKNTLGQYEWIVYRCYEGRTGPASGTPDTHTAQIIAIQETKLKEQMKLNIKEFHINCLD